LRGALRLAREMGQTCEPFQRPEATQGVAIVGMNQQRAAQVRGGSLEVAALQLEVTQHRQRERDRRRVPQRATDRVVLAQQPLGPIEIALRSEEHTSELQSRENLVCRLLLEK